MKGLAAIATLAVILAFAIFLRSWRIEAAPFHADEAVQAAIFQDLLEKGKYQYDPHHYHGPLPHYLNGIWMRAAGYKTLAELSEWQFRVLPIVAGAALVLAVGFSVWPHDRAGAVMAALLAATSPMLVFFSRFGLHESLFALFGFLASWAAVVFLRRPTWGRAALWGGLTALMAATKETWVFFALAWLLAAAGCGLFNWRLARFIPVAAGVFLLAILLLFGGEGFLDFWRSYFVYETNSGHAKPAWYFVKILFPNGRWSGEPWLWFGLLGMLGLWSRRRLAAIPLEARFLGLTGLLTGLIFSAIPYKTPWLMMLPLALCGPAAGWIFAQYRARVLQWPALAVVLCMVAWQTKCAWTVSQKRFFDSRIPLVYSPSSYQMPSFRAYLQKANGDRPIAVIGTDYWPLPWYLRGFTQVGYFDQIPDEISTGFSTYLLCDEAMEKAVPGGEERLWGVRTDYLMRSLVINPDGPDKPR